MLSLGRCDIRIRDTGVAEPDLLTTPESTEIGNATFVSEK